MLTHLRPSMYDLMEMTLTENILQPEFWRDRVQSVPLGQRLAYIEELWLWMRAVSPLAAMLQSLWEDTYFQIFQRPPAANAGPACQPSTGTKPEPTDKKVVDLIPEPPFDRYSDAELMKMGCCFKIVRKKDQKARILDTLRELSDDELMDLIRLPAYRNRPSSPTEQHRCLLPPDVAVVDGQVYCGGVLLPAEYCRAHARETLAKGL